MFMSAQNTRILFVLKLYVNILLQFAFDIQNYCENHPHFYY